MNHSANIRHLRKEYQLTDLNEKALEQNPFLQFEKWILHAMDAQVPEPNAMALATVGQDDRPSARIVLLKDYSTDGFSFFTNYLSKKGLQLATNPHAALLFFWPELEQEIRIEGKVEKLSRELSENYFLSRPFDSRIGAYVSPQSNIIKGREKLDAAFEKMKTKYLNQPLPLPENWGGYLLRPTLFEFWQGRPNRLHDRIQYRLDENQWIIERLAP